MASVEIEVNEEYRMKVVNFLKGFGDYKGKFLDMDTQKNYISGSVSFDDIIQSRDDFIELKYSVDKVLEYCYYNGFKEIANIIEYFYKIECKNIRKKYGSFFDRF